MSLVAVVIAIWLAGLALVTWRLWVVGGRRDRCTCPSGDGSLRWPCPKHHGKGRAP